MIGYLVLLAGQSRLDAWYQDIDFLASELPARHIDGTKLAEKAGFSANLERIRRDVPKLSDEQVELRLVREVASLGVAHTRLEPKQARQRRYPISARALADGVWITSASESYHELLGKRIVAVDGMPIDTVFSRLGALVPAENEAWRRLSTAPWLSIPSALCACGVAPSTEHCSITVVDEDGMRTTVVVGATTKLPPMLTAAPAHRIASGLRSWPRPYRLRILAKERAVVVEYRQCAPDPDETSAQFAQRVLGAIELTQANKVVIDLRQNQGGNSGVFQPVIRMLQGKSLPPHEVFVLTSAATFSSGMTNAWECRSYLHAKLVGEATGGSPNSYGEQKSFQLPRSGLRVTYCIRRFPLAKDTASTLEADIRVPLNWHDMARGRDVALDTVLAIR